MKLITRLCSVFIFSCIALSSANAQNMKSLGNLDVHYIALNATLITPEIAKSYGIVRSKFNGLINISVLDNTKADKPAKSVFIEGRARNDLGQIKDLDFSEVKEGSAIYYLAQVNFSDEETYYFTVNIDDGKEQHTLSFKQKFYAD